MAEPTPSREQLRLRASLTAAGTAPKALALHKGHRRGPLTVIGVLLDDTVAYLLARLDEAEHP